MHRAFRRGPRARSAEEDDMYSELWDVDVNHSEEVYVVRDEADVTGEESVDEMPYYVPRD